MNIDASPAALAELERNMRLSEDVLRYISIRVDEHEEGPSVMMQNRGSRDDRERGGERGGERENNDGHEGRAAPSSAEPKNLAAVATQTVNPEEPKE